MSIQKYKNKISSDQTEYRRDINGLRAVAVLVVILFHLHKSLIPGGFVGVDIFFVISGFLITLKILQELKHSTFSIFEFYRRRIKRIAPAMIVVVAVTLIVTRLLFLPDDLRATAKSAVYSLASLANVYFWKYQDHGYFAIDSNQVPLLHLWSLGVEEQFYLLWPLLLVLLYRAGRMKLMVITASFIAIISFLLGDVLYEHAPTFVYYMLPSRAGELLLGALAAMAVLHDYHRKISSRAVNLIATISAIVLIGSLFLITEQQPYPGWRSLLPTAATALLILVGSGYKQNISSRLLSVKPLVAIGLISYSAYLWHWPLLAIFRYGYGEPSLGAAVLVLPFTLILAWLSYRYIEQPARRTSASFFNVFTKQYFGPASVLISFSMIAIYPERLGISLYTEFYQRQLDSVREQTRPAYEYPWVCQRQNITVDDIRNPKCVIGKEALIPPKAILWGDSHAAHYIGIVAEIARHAKFSFRNIEIGSCPPIDSDPSQFVGPKRSADCHSSLPIVFREVEKFPVVVISSDWSGYQERSSDYLATFFKTVSRLTSKGKLVILLGDPPIMPGFDRHCREKAFTYPFLKCPEIKVSLASKVSEINKKLRYFAEHMPNVRYFDVNNYICSSGICSSHASSGEPLYFDPSHLALVASYKIGREIVNKYGIPEPFALITIWKDNQNQKKKVKDIQSST